MSQIILDRNLARNQIQELPSHAALTPEFCPAIIYVWAAGCSHSIAKLLNMLLKPPICS